MAVATILSSTFAETKPRGPGKQQVLATLHTATRMRGWTLGALHWNKYPMSFHWAAIETGSGAVSLLVHADRPVAALTPGEPQYMALTFLDDETFGNNLADCGADFVLLTARALATPVGPDDAAFVRALGRDFAANLAYWKPKTAGEVIFNWWD